MHVYQKQALGACYFVLCWVFAFDASAAPSHLRGAYDSPAQAPVHCTDSSCFTLTGVEIEGVTLFKADAFAPLYQPYLGRLADLNSLAQIADTITERYRRAGYFLSRAVVPPQNDLASGLARIVVIEGRIAEIAYEGDGADLAGAIIDGLDTTRPTRLQDLERRLTLAGDVPGITVRSRVEPDPHDPAWHRLVVTADRKPVEAYGSIDNRGSQSVGPWQAFTEVAVNSAFVQRDQLGLSLFTTPGDFQKLTQVGLYYGYTQSNGAVWSVNSVVSRRRDGADPKSLELGGDATLISLQYMHPLVRRRGFGLWLDAAFDIGSFANDWPDGGSYSDQTRVLRTGLRSTWDRNHSSSLVELTASFGLNALGASKQSDFERSQPDASGRFTKFNLRLSRYQDFGRNFGLYALAEGQWSADPLFLSEEFSIGGRPIGRGYDYGELIGDHGAGGLLEFRAGTDTRLELVNFVQAYAFIDAGKVWNYNIDPGSQGLSLASTGLGTRITFLDRVTLNIEAALPLTLTPLSQKQKDWRQYFGLSFRY